MTDLDDLCDKVSRNRSKYNGLIHEFTTTKGIKRQYNRNLLINGNKSTVWYMMYKAVNGDRCRATIRSATFDVNENFIGE